MPTLEVVLNGGPFDGHTEQCPDNPWFRLYLPIAPHYDPGVRAVYRLRSRTTGAVPRLVYDYVRTVAA